MSLLTSEFCNKIIQQNSKTVTVKYNLSLDETISLYGIKVALFISLQ